MRVVVGKASARLSSSFPHSLSTTGQEATAPRDRIHRRKALNQAPLHQRSPAFARDDPEESRADDPALLQSAPVVYT